MNAVFEYDYLTLFVMFRYGEISPADLRQPFFYPLHDTGEFRTFLFFILSDWKIPVQMSKLWWGLYARAGHKVEGYSCFSLSVIKSLRLFRSSVSKVLLKPP